MRNLIIPTILALAGSAPAVAGPDRVSLLFGSHHADIQIEVEEVNPGLFLEWEFGETPAFYRTLRPDMDRKPRTVAGVFRNSFGDAAAALAVAWPVFGEEAFQFDFITGAAWYPGNGERVLVSAGDFIPYVGLQVKYRLAYMLAFPGDGESYDALFAFGLSFPLGGN